VTGPLIPWGLPEGSFAHPQVINVGVQVFPAKKHFAPVANGLDRENLPAQVVLDSPGADPQVFRRLWNGEESLTGASNTIFVLTCNKI